MNLVVDNIKILSISSTVTAPTPTAPTPTANAPTPTASTGSTCSCEVACCGSSGNCWNKGILRDTTTNGVRSCTLDSIPCTFCSYSANERDERKRERSAERHSEQSASLRARDERSLWLSPREEILDSILIPYQVQFVLGEQNTYTDASSAYASCTVNLVIAVSSGGFDANLRANAAHDSPTSPLYAASTDGVPSITVLTTASAPTPFPTFTFNSSDAAAAVGLSVGIIVAIVIAGLVLFVCLPLLIFFGGAALICSLCRGGNTKIVVMGPTGQVQHGNS